MTMRTGMLRIGLRKVIRNKETMTTLEKWAEEYLDETYNNHKGGHLYLLMKKSYMDGYQASSKRSHTPPEPCPPGHNCPDCGSSIVEGITD
jgi:hypothetical protein